MNLHGSYPASTSTHRDSVDPRDLSLLSCRNEHQKTRRVAAILYASVYAEKEPVMRWSLNWEAIASRYVVTEKVSA